MATLNEIAYSILSQTYNFNISDDIDVDLDWIYYQIAMIRNVIIEKEQSENIFKFEKDKYYYFSRVNCVPVECVDIAECCDIYTDCFIRKITLPTKILYPSLFTVQTVNRKINFAYERPPMINFALKRRLLVSHGYWYHENKNLYLVSNISNIELVSLYGIFENPEKLKELQNCNKEPCYNAGTQEYPVQVKHIPFIEQYIVNLIRTSLTNVKDLSNNALDDAINTIRGDMETLNNQLNNISPKK